MNAYHTNNRRIGIDMGALFTKVVCLDHNDIMSGSFYERHQGNPLASLKKAFDELKVTDDDTVGITGNNADCLTEQQALPVLDTTFCQIQGIKHKLPSIRFIIDIGGVSSTLIQLTADGAFEGFAANSMCAAGTGSFLDEQAARLGISYEDLSRFKPVDSPPSIATRCSVFAKSDLIHRQQEGYGSQEMWSGLCRGMTRTLLGTLLHGRPLNAQTAVIGGVALNKEVIRWLNLTCPHLINVPENPQFMAAFGAALNANTKAGTVSFLGMNPHAPKTITRFDWPLTMEKSKYPSFEIGESSVDEDASEIRISKLPGNPFVSVYLGIDIGSTSTKLVLVNEKKEVLVDVYRKTLGNPIKATQLLFKSLRQLSENKKIRFDILGVGTTGSGRKIVGALIGADCVMNEISSHVAGATHTDPGVDTIFEIGGQDSKYMHLVDGHIRDANMNYVCAAGTGSFIEALASKLGFPIAEAGQSVLGITPPRATDRCTVFMEQDITRLMQNGATPQEAFAAVTVSVIKNYLNKVVGNRHYSRNKIFFQGATARNPALVAAFERVLGCEIVVSPYCHVMGAFGVALLTMESMQSRHGTVTSQFRGLAIEKKKITIRKEQCDLCPNDCAITFGDIEGIAKGPSWGYLCGRDPDDSKVRVTPHYQLMRKRQRLLFETGRGIKLPDNAPVIGIPQAFNTYTYLPLWRSFFNSLGCKIQLSGETTAEIRSRGTEMAGADFCFPAKVMIGHACALHEKDGVDYIFIPQMTHAQGNDCTTASVFCPYVQGSPSYVKSAFKLNNLQTDHILDPVVDMRLDPAALAQRLAATLREPLKKTRLQIRQAWINALAAQHDFTEFCYDEGKKALIKAKKHNEKLVVLIGRPYNNFDTGINLGIPQKLSEQGRTIIPLDFIRPQLKTLKGQYKNTYWDYGQKILATLYEVKNNDLLDAVYLTNFSCGPDSFLLSYAEEIMGNKPFLVLELDEHGADAGYMTRIEAFFDVLKKPHLKPEKKKQASAWRNDATKSSVLHGMHPRSVDFEIPRHQAGAWRNDATKSSVLHGTHPRSVNCKMQTHKYKEPTDDFKERILWVPDMHPYGARFLAASLNCHGYTARTLPESTAETFEIGRTHTRGSECLPTALTIGRLIKTLNESKDEGKKHAFFMPTAQGPCRFGQYATLHRQILDKEGFNDVSILSPTSFNGYQGLDEPIRRTIWKSMLASDILFKSVCKVRPYEISKGQTDQTAHDLVSYIAAVIEKNGDLVSALHHAVKNIFSIPVNNRHKKPLVGVVGEIYIRNNPYANENLIRSIEDLGGEAWMVPVSEWILYTSCPRNIAGHHAYKISWNTVRSYIKWRWMYHWERKLYRAASPFLDDRHEPRVNDTLDAGFACMAENIGGEAVLSLGRAIKYAAQGASMVVNVAPFCCMPVTVTTALFRQIAAELGMPIVNLFYDGTGGQNERLKVYLKNALEGERDHKSGHALKDNVQAA
ncbi:MAG: hypothetical protein HQM16_12880 [Deltaproteobacteria bacterium]|nr:hypothetical protein [Deltaproteobacteria bacterium]